MQRLNGRSREVVICKNRTTGEPLPRRGLGTSTLMLYCMQCLSYDMCSSMLFFVHSKYSSILLLTAVLRIAANYCFHGSKLLTTVTETQG